MQEIIQNWLKTNHPHSNYLYHLITGSKVKIFTNYLDNSNTRHGHGSGDHITETFLVDKMDILK